MFDEYEKVFSDKNKTDLKIHILLFCLLVLFILGFCLILTDEALYNVVGFVMCLPFTICFSHYLFRKDS